MHPSQKLNVFLVVIWLLLTKVQVLAQHETRFVPLGRSLVVPEVLHQMSFRYQQQWEHFGRNINGSNTVDAVWKDCEKNRLYYGFGNAVYAHEVGRISALPLDSAEDNGIASDWNVGQAFLVPQPGRRDRLVYFNMYMDFSVPAVFHKQNIRVGYYGKDANNIVFLGGIDLDTQVVGAIGVVRHRNMRDYWLVTAARISPVNSVLKVYALSSSGVALLPSFEMTYHHPSTLNINALQMVVSPMNNRIVVSAAENYITVFDFDNNSGRVVQSFGFDFYRRFPGPFGIFGLRMGAFSSGGERFYLYYLDARRTNMRRQIVQFDGMAADSALFYQSLSGFEVQSEFPESFHLGRDGRLYISTRNLNTTVVSMTRFNEPSAFGLGAQLQLAYHVLYTPDPTAIQRFHFANTIPDFNRKDRFIIQGVDTLCVGDVHEFKLSENHRLDSVWWQYDDPLTHQTIYVSNQVLRLRLEVASQLTLHAIGFYCDSVITFSKALIIQDIPSDSLHDVALCGAPEILVQAPQDQSEVIQWSNGVVGPTISISQPGWYWLERQNHCGLYRDSFYVHEYDYPNSGLPRDTLLCEGVTELVLNANAGSAQFLWWDGDSSLSKTIRWPGTYFYTIANACVSITDTVHVHQTEWITELAYDTAACESRPFIFTLEGIKPNLVKASWSDGQTSFPRRFVDYFDGTVQLTTICDTAEVQVKVNPLECNCKVYAPTAFSPNGDGLNEVFLPVSSCSFLSFGLSVYDRWGKTYYFSQDPTRGWDGQMDGQRAPEGMYTFRLFYTTPDYGGLRLKEGLFYLIW